jgi:hypothetical protein
MWDAADEESVLRLAASIGSVKDQGLV